MVITQGIGVAGAFEVRVLNALTGQVLRRMTIKNMIVNGGYDAIIQSLANGVTTSRITTLAVGKGGATPAALTQTALANPLVNITSFTTDVIAGTAHQVKITATLDAATGNGTVDQPNNVSEVGLITAGGALFSRQVHPAITKTAAIAIQYEWIISLVAAA
jgi:hypothetical protein